jgi:integrase
VESSTDLALPATSQSRWQKTQYANLIRYVPSGVYFARVRVGGKLFRRSLATHSLSVAKLKLGDLEKTERTKLEQTARLVAGKAIFRDLLAEYRKRLADDHTLKPRSKTYREERIAAMLKSWPMLKDTDVQKLTEDACRGWASAYALRVSPTNYNNTIGTLKAILQLGVEQGLRYSNPAANLKRVRVRAKEMTLPTQDQFLGLVTEIRRIPFGPGLASADLVEFLGYGGFRKSEAANVTWADCDFAKGEIIVRGDPITGTKNSEVRRVPMIPDMVGLLDRLRSERPAATPDNCVMRVKECQGAITRACSALGIRRFTHHDLRHLFATRGIESGVDIPTVSRWLGHKDGGALAMKVYGHLRDQHSAAMAQKVTFAKPKTQHGVQIPTPPTA